MKIVIAHLILILNMVSIFAFLINYIGSSTRPEVSDWTIVILNIIVSAFILTALYKDNNGKTTK